MSTATAPAAALDAETTIRTANLDTARTTLCDSIEGVTVQFVIALRAGLWPNVIEALTQIANATHVMFEAEVGKAAAAEEAEDPEDVDRSPLPEVPDAR